MTNSKKNIALPIFLSFGTLIVYTSLLLIFYKTTPCLEPNEFGDYVGGLLNPLFSLLSSVAIIYLTYIIAKNEIGKANESIATQKRITLNQMRQEQLSILLSKLNSFAYQMDKIPLKDVKRGSFVQRALTNQSSEVEKPTKFMWLTILHELEEFTQFKYLFNALFEDKEFMAVYDSTVELVVKINEEISDYKMITSSTLEEYIEAKQKLISLIGNFIISEF